MMQLAEINHIVSGTLYGEDIAVETVSINTRTLQPGDLYLAIKGENFDGNDFVEQAEQAKASAAILNKVVDTCLPYIVVDDTRKALAQLATAWRRKLGVQVVGITGSNGKTTVKEMTAAILAENAPVLFTQGNLNNDIGVPLTLLNIQPQHRYAVIEMGANHPGEISYTSACALPDVAVLNNVGAAHIEGFGDLDGVAKAKGEIVSGLGEQGIAILNADDFYFDYWKTLAGARRVMTFGLQETADVYATNIHSAVQAKQFVSTFTLHRAEQTISVNLSLPGRHNVLNALAAATACSALGITMQEIKQGLEKMGAVTGRLQALLSKQGGIVIDDTYNANPSSLKAALQVLVDCPGEPWLVLGAFGELGSETVGIHAEMGETIKKMGVSRLFATGSDAKKTVHVFGDGGFYFDSKQSLIERLQAQLTAQQTVLIKGSRAQQMEQVAAALVENFRDQTC